MSQWVVLPRCVTIWCIQILSFPAQNPTYPPNFIPNPPIKIQILLQANLLVAHLLPPKQIFQKRQTSKATPRILTTQQPCTLKSVNTYFRKVHIHEKLFVVGGTSATFESHRFKRVVQTSQLKVPAICLQIQVELQISGGSRSHNPEFAKRHRKSGKRSKTIRFPFYPRPDHN